MTNINPLNETNSDYLLRYLRAPGRETAPGRFDFSAVSREVARCALHRAGIEAPACDAQALYDACAFIDSRQDCIDFAMAGILRLLMAHGDSPLLPRELRARMREAMLAAPYWIDEPGTDELCMFTENHLALYHSSEYLAGLLYPDALFPNSGRDGDWHRRHAEPLLRMWLQNRLRFGFCEWLSNNYYDEDLLALSNLSALCPDGELRWAARRLTDILFVEIAAHTHKGVMGCTHGRAYVPNITNPVIEPVRGLLCAFFGIPCPDVRVSLSAPLLCDGGYQPPKEARAALEVQEPVVIRTHQSFPVSRGADYGLDPAEDRNLTAYWGMQVFEHPLVVEATLRVLPQTHYHRGVAESFAAYYEDCRTQGKPIPQDLDFFALTEVNTYTYRTPEAMLSAALGFRTGQGGYQQHIWQATLGERAMVFTTQPGSATYSNADRPNQFHGNAVLPRVLAHEGMVIALHRPNPALCRIFHTHAYFPRAAFDEVREENGWVFGRKGEGFVALRSLRPARWAQPVPEMTAITGLSPDAPYEWIASSGSNAYICEVGSRAQWGSFQRFAQAYAAAPLGGSPLRIAYASPVYGPVRAGYFEPLVVAGAEIAQGDFPRHDSPWLQSGYASGEYFFGGAALAHREACPGAPEAVQ